jgi:hypothetical protein
LAWKVVPRGLTTSFSGAATLASAPRSWAGTCSVRSAENGAPRTGPDGGGGTTFHFVDDGIEAAVSRAFDAAGGGDVRLGGGVATIQQYLRAGLIDEMHLAVVPIFLGGGERLFDHLEGGPLGYECVEFVSSPAVAHIRFVANLKESDTTSPGAHGARSVS